MFAKFRKATVSLVVSVGLCCRMEQLGSHSTVFHSFWHLSIVSKIHVWWKSEKTNWYSWRPIYTYENISLDSLKVRNFSNKSCWENQKTHLMFSNLFSGNHTVYEIMWNTHVCMYVCMYVQGAAFNVTHFESRITHLLYTAINTTEHGQVSQCLGFTKRLTSSIQRLGDVLHDNQGISAISQVHLPWRDTECPA